VIHPLQLSSDEDLARRILVRARSIAPGIDLIPDDDDRKLDAIAILKGVIAEIPAPGAGRVKSRGRNGTTISYNDPRGAFTDDDMASLRSLVAALPAGLPIGSFPEARAFGREWAEGPYS
jgi:hypothetical protein